MNFFTLNCFSEFSYASSFCAMKLHAISCIIRFDIIAAILDTELLFLRTTHLFLLDHFFEAGLNVHSSDWNAIIFLVPMGWLHLYNLCLVVKTSTVV